MTLVHTPMSFSLESGLNPYGKSVWPADLCKFSTNLKILTENRSFMCNISDSVVEIMKQPKKSTTLSDFLLKFGQFMTKNHALPAILHFSNPSYNFALFESQLQYLHTCNLQYSHICNLSS